MKEHAAEKKEFARHGGMARTAELRAAGINHYRLQQLMADGLVECVRRGYYQWIGESTPSDVRTLSRLFPDAVFCMHTALFHYGYTDRTPDAWHLAVSKFSNRKRFCLHYPAVQPHFLTPTTLQLGVCRETIDGIPVHMHNRDRVICDCLRFRNSIDPEILRKAVRAYVEDPHMNTSQLLDYAQRLRCRQSVQNLIEPWL